MVAARSTFLQVCNLEGEGGGDGTHSNFSVDYAVFLPRPLIPQGSGPFAR